jgi:hypothetical protein
MVVYPQKVVAFIDVLGFRDAVNGATKTPEKVIEDIQKAFTDSLTFLQNSPAKKWSSIRMFSDCICISAEKEHVLDLLAELAFVQLSFATNELFVRGGVSIGNHFEDDQIIFSRGLIGAYDLEQRTTYPRIAVAQEVIDLISQRNDGTRPLLLRAPDQEWFIDYLQIVRPEEFGFVSFMKDVYQTLAGHQQALIRKARVSWKDPKLLLKFRWLVEYHNFKCSQIVEKDQDYQLGPELVIPEAIFPPFRNEN